MPDFITDYLFLLAVFSPYILILLLGLRGGSTKAMIRAAKSAGHYESVEIDGKQYHAIRKKETLLRSSSGRGLAILVSLGRDRDPNMVNGKVKMFPRWIKIRSVTKKGLSEHERWVSAEGWSYYDEKEISYHIPFEN